MCLWVQHRCINRFATIAASQGTKRRRVDFICDLVHRPIAKRHVESTGVNAAETGIPSVLRIGVHRIVLCWSEPGCLAEVIVETGEGAFIVGAVGTGVIVERIEVFFADHHRMTQSIGDFAEGNHAALKADSVKGRRAGPSRPSAAIGRGKTGRSAIALGKPLAAIRRVDRRIRIADRGRVIAAEYGAHIVTIDGGWLPDIGIQRHAPPRRTSQQRDQRGETLDIGGVKSAVGQPGTDAVDGVLFNVGKDVICPSTGLRLTKTPVRVASPVPTPAPSRQVLVRVVVHLPGQAELLQMIRTMDPIG